MFSTLSHIFMSLHCNHCWSFKHALNIIPSKNLTYFNKTPIIQHKAFILKEIYAMPPDSLLTELHDSLTAFYENILKKTKTTTMPEAAPPAPATPMPMPTTSSPLAPPSSPFRRPCTAAGSCGESRCGSLSRVPPKTGAAGFWVGRTKGWLKHAWACIAVIRCTCLQYSAICLAELQQRIQPQGTSGSPMKVFTWYIPGIYLVYHFLRFLPGIYRVYLGIYQVYWSGCNFSVFLGLDDRTHNSGWPHLYYIAKSLTRSNLAMLVSVKNIFGIYLVYSRCMLGIIYVSTNFRICTWFQEENWLQLSTKWMYTHQLTCTKVGTTSESSRDQNLLRTHILQYIPGTSIYQVYTCHCPPATHFLALFVTQALLAALDLDALRIRSALGTDRPPMRGCRRPNDHSHS